MGLPNPISKAKKIAQRGIDIAERLPKAAETFGSQLATNVKKEATTPGTAGYRFANAPLGQYYLPRPVQKVAGFVLPTPGGVTKSYAKGIREGGLKGGARAGLTTFDVLSTPMLISGAGKLATKAPRAADVVGRALSREGMLGSEAGFAKLGKSAGKAAEATGVTNEMLSKLPGGAMAAAKKKVAATAAADISSVAKKAVGAPVSEFKISRVAGKLTINSVPYGDIVGGKATVPGLTKDVVLQEGFRAAVSKVNAGKAGEIVFKAEAPVKAAAKAAVKPAEAVAAAAPKVKAALPEGESLFRTGTAADIGKKAARAATKAGPLKVTKMSPEAKASFTKTAQATVENEVAAGVRTVTGAVKEGTGLVGRAEAPVSKAAEVAAKAPKVKAAVKATVKTAAAAPTAPVEAAVKNPRAAVRTILQSGKVSRGVFAKVAREHGISRQRIGQIVISERKAIGAVPEAAGAAESKAAEVVAKAPKVKAAVAAAAKTASKVAPETKVTAEKLPEDLAQTAAKTVAQRVKGLIPKKTLVVGGVAAGGAALLANRDKFGATSSAPKSDENAWVSNLPPDLQKNVKALMEVKAKKGEAGLRALQIGLGTTQKVAYLANKQTSFRARKEGITPEDEYLRENVRLAYRMTKKDKSLSKKG